VAWSFGWSVLMVVVGEVVLIMCSGVAAAAAAYEVYSFFSFMGWVWMVCRGRWVG